MSKFLLCIAFLFSVQQGNSQTFLSENFETSTADNWTLINASTGGTPANAAWTIRQSPYSTNGSTFISPNTSKFIMSNSDAQGQGSITNATLKSPSFSTLGSTTVFINFFHYFSYFDDTDSAVVEVSINGTTWTQVASYNYPDADEGVPGSFFLRSINISALAANKASVFVRFRHHALWAFQWALDNITVTSTPVILPVKLVDFSGSSKAGQNLLHWTTSTEINNKGFELQRSLDGNKYAPVQFINTKSADGNSNTTLRYEFADLNPVGATQYYRLKQIDQDGNYSYSNVVVLKTQGRNYFISGIYPNPVTDKFNIAIQSAKQERSRLQVFDLAGRIVLDKTYLLEQGANNIKLPAQQLKPGTYFTRLLLSDGTALQDKFVKQ